MKFCVDHWVELREAIKRNGLFELVSKTPEQVIERAVSGYDPMLTAYMNLCTYVLKMAGSAAKDLAASQKCPLCELNLHSTTKIASVVLNDAVGAEQTFAIKQKLIVPVPNVH